MVRLRLFNTVVFSCFLWHFGRMPPSFFWRGEICGNEMPVKEKFLVKKRWVKLVKKKRWERTPSLLGWILRHRKHGDNHNNLPHVMSQYSS